jgi:hypothetical protein
MVRRKATAMKETALAAMASTDRPVEKRASFAPLPDDGGEPDCPRVPSG